MSNKHRNKKRGNMQNRTNRNVELSFPMPSKVKEDIVTILEKAITLLETKPIDAPELEILSTNTIHNASIYQDKDSMNISIVMYSLYKLFSVSIVKPEQKVRLIAQFKKIKGLLVNEDYKNYRLQMGLLIKFISTINKQFTQYVQAVMDKARVKKGSDLYRHGISIGMVADLFGTSEWEVMSYIGKTNMNDDMAPTDASTRLKIAKELFGV